MIKCNKRQKIVNRNTNETNFKCLNKHSSFYKQKINEEICQHCDFVSRPHENPCKKTNIKEGNINEDEKILKELKEEGIDVEELKNKDIDYPSFIMQLMNYKEALIKWKKAGKPTRNKEEVDQLHTTYCSKCDWYDQEKKRCKGCGCKVTTGDIAIFNKIKMATEHCPKEHW